MLCLEENQAQALRQKLSNIFDGAIGDPNQLSDDEVTEFASYYRNGVHMATPVF